MVNKITPWFIHIFIEPSRSLHYKFQHSPLNRDENWDVTGLLLGLRGAGAADAGAHLAQHLPDHGDGSSRAIALRGASAAAAPHVIMFLRPAVARAT